MNEQQFDRLPKYAQRQIERLRANVASLQRREIKMKGDSLVWMGVLEERRVFLPDNEVFVFDIRPKDAKIDLWRHHVTVQMETLHNGQRRLTIRGGEALAILPSASNAVYIKMEDI